MTTGIDSLVMTCVFLFCCGLNHGRKTCRKSGKIKASPTFSSLKRMNCLLQIKISILLIQEFES